MLLKAESPQTRPKKRLSHGIRLARNDTAWSWSLHVAPIGADFCVRENRHRKLVNAFHDFLRQTGEAWNFGFGALKEKFVVDLQDHAGFEFFFGEPAIQFN